MSEKYKQTLCDSHHII